MRITEGYCCDLMTMSQILFEQLLNTSASNETLTTDEGSSFQTCCGAAAAKGTITNRISNLMIRGVPIVIGCYNSSSRDNFVSNKPKTAGNRSDLVSYGVKNFAFKRCRNKKIYAHTCRTTPELWTLIYL